jgi:hypothetical protein
LYSNNDRNKEEVSHFVGILEEIAAWNEWKGCWQVTIVTDSEKLAEMNWIELMSYHRSKMQR